MFTTAIVVATLVSLGWIAFEASYFTVFLKLEVCRYPLICIITHLLHLLLIMLMKLDSSISFHILFLYGNTILLLCYRYISGQLIYTMRNGKPHG
jgi:hypothetical protein